METRTCGTNNSQTPRERVRNVSAAAIVTRSCLTVAAGEHSNGSQMRRNAKQRRDFTLIEATHPTGFYTWSTGSAPTQSLFLTCKNGKCFCNCGILNSVQIESTTSIEMVLYFAAEYKYKRSLQMKPSCQSQPAESSPVLSSYRVPQSALCLPQRRHDTTKEWTWTQKATCWFPAVGQRLIFSTIRRIVSSSTGSLWKLPWTRSPNHTSEYFSVL